MADGGGEDQIGLAWSIDGINWKKCEDNPVLPVTVARETCEDPHLVKCKSTYYLHYNTWYWSPNRTSATGGSTMVLLRNLLVWQRHQNRNRAGIRKANSRKGRVVKGEMVQSSLFGGRPVRCN